MPIRRVKGGFKWGGHGHVYPNRKGAERQAAAAHANGFHENQGENMEAIDFLQAADMLEEIQEDLAESLGKLEKGDLQEGWYQLPPDHPNHKQRSKEMAKDAKEAHKAYPHLAGIAAEHSAEANHASKGAQKGKVGHQKAAEKHRKAQQSHINAAGTMHVIRKYGNPHPDAEKLHNHHDMMGAYHGGKASEHQSRVPPESEISSVA